MDPAGPSTARPRLPASRGTSKKARGVCGISPGWPYLGEEGASVLEIVNQDRFPALSGQVELT